MGRTAVCVAAASVMLILWRTAHHTPATAATAVTATPVSAATATPPSPATATALLAQSATTADRAAGAPQAGAAVPTIQVIVGRNDTMDGIFGRMRFDKADLATIRDLPGVRQSLDFLKPGDAIKIKHSAGEIEELTLQVSETQTLRVVRGDAGFTATMISNPVDRRVRTATATIDSSLFQAAEAVNMSDIVALKLANVFAWDIDFVLDIRRGDRFTVVYEQIYQDGRYLRDGEVLAAQFTNNGRVYRAVRFENDPGRAGYYTPDGKPMRKAFLRAPVEFTRVSSVFNASRLHPILNLIRGHMGTDYAAPTGTPVHAAGDARVSFAGRRGGYGNAVVLTHSNSVSTLYGHLSRFAKNVHLGSHVQQGEVIGYVGMTGLATGPHLHYEFLLNGVHKNPQTVRLPGAEPLHAGSLQRFRGVAGPLLADLTPPPATTTGAIAATAASGDSRSGISPN